MLRPLQFEEYSLITGYWALWGVQKQRNDPVITSGLCAECFGRSASLDEKPAKLDPYHVTFLGSRTELLGI